MSHIIRLPDVIKMTGLSRSSIYAMMDKKLFPMSLKIGPRAIGWLNSDIQEWIDAKVKGASIK